ncbi:FAD-dependent monooxygenase [Fulvimarina sp. 2208YS6-2-32]|uniref:FAD-dependent monooxygenase n=1 Tax=Fulvimarina uroteuthidis TaxID=3098149 RepID=A0ABU5HXN6_9HYPH|nr:FAD-dependent monooxygenase [Fulvimarina sp. 2208YS6-2-32]MDY8107896.1 FAD-dependent monooxygenase [Fulvimarina sp. 2208YS6-2-32]
MRSGGASRSPLVIAGAGPVGLALAVEAVRRGLAVRICDQKSGPTPADQSRALGILPTTLAVLEASGVAGRLLAEGQPIHRVAIAWNGRPAATIRLDAAETPTPFILSLAQARTERALIDWLGAHGVPVEWGIALTDLAHTQRPTATLSTGETIEALAIAGCDGMHSTVRRSLDIPFVGDDHPARFALADIVCGQEIDAECAKVLLSQDQATAAFLPFGPHGGRLIGVCETPDALVARWPDIASVGWTSRFAVAFRHAERMSRGQIYLCGDAAHVHSPVGGRGMNLGVWDAAWLAFLLAEGRQSEYESRRVPVVKAVLDETRAMTDFITAPPAWAGAAVRFALPAALRVPGVARRAANRLLALHLKQPEWL